MVSLWFSNEANSLTRIGLLDVVREELKKGPYKQRDQVVSSRLEKSPKRKQTISEGPCFVKQRTRRGERGQSPRSTLSLAKFTSASLWKAQLLQNTLLKEKVLQEEDGILSRMSSQESVQNSVNPFFEAVVNSV